MRKDRLAEVQDMRKCCLRPAEIRDFLMLEVLLSSTGMRSDAVYNITICELHSEKSTQTASGKWVVAIKVHEHKTQKTYGPQRVTMTKALYDLLVLFQVHVRPQLSVSKPGPEDKLFVRSSMRAGEQSETVTTMSSAINFFKIASECNLPITAKSYRYYFTHLAHYSADPEVRQNVPAHLGHSKEISDRVYLRGQEQRQEWANYRETLIPNDEQELVAPVDEAVQAEAAAERTAIREVAKQKFLKDQKTTGAAYGPKRKFSDEERA
jgi:site-specific recombinase XerD